MRCQVCIILQHGCDFLLYAADENFGSSWIIRTHNLQKNLSSNILMAKTCKNTTEFESNGAVDRTLSQDTSSQSDRTF